MSRANFLLFPQWQASPSTRAMELCAGAAALRDEIPSSHLEVTVPLEAGDSIGTPVARLSSVLKARDEALKILRDLPGPVITLGGDSGSALAGISHAFSEAESADDVALVWLSAKPRFVDPLVSETGAVGDSLLRYLSDSPVPDLAPAVPVPANNVWFVGTRAFTPEEDTETASAGFRSADWLTASSGAEVASSMLAEFEEIGIKSVYVFCDLGVLDPSEFDSVHEPYPFGPSLRLVTETLRELLKKHPLCGASITEFAPASEIQASDATPQIMRIIGSLLSGGKA